MEWRELLQTSLLPAIELGLAFSLLLLFRIKFKIFSSSNLRRALIALVVSSLAGVVAATFLYLNGRWIQIPDFFKGRELLTWVCMVVAAPIAEETLFRGAIYGVLQRKGYSPRTAVMVTALVFGAGHLIGLIAPGGSSYVAFFILQAFYAGALGVLLGDVRRTSGALLVPMLCHALANFAFLGATYLFNSQ